MTIRTSCFAIAQRFSDVREIDGRQHHPLIQWGFLLCGMGPETPDEVPWCSAFAQIPTFILDLPRSKSARARSWLNVGMAITLAEAEPGNDVVILKRGTGHQPGPEVIAAPGHVGFFAGAAPDGRVLLLGGNQSDAVSVAPFRVEDVLGVRRLT